MSDSTFYETTFSTDQRIESEIKALRQIECEHKASIQNQRSLFFGELYSKKTNPIFSLLGLHFVYFTHKKIKFYFRPSDTARCVKKNFKFYCKLIYYDKYCWWAIKYDSFPLNYKAKIYSWFNKDNVMEDEKIVDMITIIYRMLLTWSIKHENHVKEKYMKYKRGELEDLDMDSDDRELFTAQETSTFIAKRRAILKRMLFPKDRDNFDEIEKKLFRRSCYSSSDSD